MEHVEGHNDYTSLKRSLSGISRSHADHAEHIKMKEPKSSKPTPRLNVNIPLPKVTEIAFAALQNLPMPLIVLSSLKTILLANEAMGRLLGLHPEAGSGQQESVTDVLIGQTLSQIGIDMLQDGVLLHSEI
jgi:PAS domain-containing protein